MRAFIGKAGRALRGILKRISELRLCRGAAIYLVLLIFCLIFTQALRSSLSAVIYVFIICLPTADLILLLIPLRYITVALPKQKVYLEKQQNADIALSIKNRGLLPVSCAEIDFSIPDALSAGCTFERKSIPLPPFSSTEVRTSVSFELMGKYSVGADRMRIYSLFRIFAVVRQISASATVCVLPERLEPCGIIPVGESNGGLENLISGIRTDTEDIRQYLPGDSIKAVHWKLSTKTDELQVKKYLSDNGRAISILCDFGGGCPRDLPQYARVFAADRIAAETLAAMREAAGLGKVGQLIINREISPMLDFSVPSDADELAERLCETDIAVCSPGVAGLSASAFGNAVLYVTSFVPGLTARYITDASALLGAGRVSVCLCDISPLYGKEDREQYRTALEDLCRKLGNMGIRITVPQRDAKEDGNENG